MKGQIFFSSSATTSLSEVSCPSVVKPTATSASPWASAWYLLPRELTILMSLKLTS